MRVTIREVQEAHAEWVRAQQEFEMAAPEFIDAATHKLTAAEKRYDALMRIAKKEGVIDEAC
ncbi:MAG TPA: hypothetical protein GX517_11920 [Alicyclobacillus sp.]|nr:hypothetical protein [Alicyclobacillus sp.]